MRTTRKIFLALVLTLAVAAVMSVCAFAAYNLDLDLPAGAVKGDEKWIDSGYSDIDADGSGWIMIGGAVDYSGTTESYPTIAKADVGRFYWNKATDKGVYVVTSSNMSANWEDWNPVSSANPTAADQKKMYAFASAFVDEMFGYYGSGAYQKALDGDVAADKEASVYVNGSKVSSYTVYNRYVNTYKKASAQWTNFAVTKASYDSFVAKRAELEAAGTTGEALEDALVEFVYANFAGYKMARNVKENGSFVMLTWVWKQLADNGYVFDTLEFRTKQAEPYFSTFGLALKAAEVKTILFDSKINAIAIDNVDRGMFYGIAELKTFDHVTFADDGTHEAVTANVVDLRGFIENTKSYGAGPYYFSDLFVSSTGIEEVIWFDTIINGEAEKAGLIDLEDFRYCSGLKKITLSAPLTGIGSNAFGSCTALTTIDLKGGVAEGATVNAAAFTSATQAISVYVYSAADEAKAKAIFADFTNITVENKSATEAAITADGFSIRLDDSTSLYKGPALRAEFTLVKAKVDEVKSAEGYDLADYGMVVFSENTYNAYGSVDAIIAAIQGGLDETAQKKIKVVSAASGPYVSVNANGDKTFAAAITGIGAANYDSAVYTYAYAAWSNGTDTKYTYTTYISPRVANKSAHSLYDATVFAYANGIVNSQTFNMSTGVELWDILQKGALSVTEAETKSYNTTLLALTQGYEYDAQGKFTYLDLPLRAWNMYKNSSGKVVWNSRGVTVEETATTGILWSILENGNDYVVVYRADPTFDGNATLPKLSDSYGASAPYSSKYFNVTAASQVTEDPTANGLLKTATIYSPILTDANSNNIKAIVIDYGVDVLGEQSLCTASVTTIVYPEGLTAGNYLLAGCTNLKNLVYVTADKSYLADYNVESLVDLTGFPQVSDYGVAMNAAAVENILLPEAAKIKNGQQYGFGGAKALTRVWTVGFDMPEAGVMDLSQTGIKTICKGYFNNLDNIDDVYMPESFTAVSAYSMATKNQTTDTARWNVFGNNSSETKLNIHVENWKALNCIANTFYEARQDPAYNNGKENSGIEHYVDYLKLTYEGVTKTVLEWRADFPADPDAAQ